MRESVNHPAHYGGEGNPYEVIKVMESWMTREEFIGALRFQICKYTARAGKKGPELEDYRKAAWYANYGKYILAESTAGVHYGGER